MSKEKKGGAHLNRAVNTSQRAPARRAPASKPRSAQGQPRGKKPMGTGSKVVLVILLVLLLAILSFLVWYKFCFAVLPNQPAAIPDAPVTARPSIDPNTGEETMVPTPASDRKKDFFTFLIVGRDTVGGGNTDTMMLASYDLANQKLSVMSLPRDTMVDARHPGNNRKLNAVYNLCKYYAEDGDDRTGIDYLKEAVGDLVGFTPDYYVYINWEAFGRLVDAIGGVYFEVPFDMHYWDPAQDLLIDQSAGYRLLSGDDAMQVVRWRHNNDYSVQYRDGDLGRIRTQQALLKEIVKACLKIENVTKIGEFAQIFTDEVETDLTLGNLVAFAERAIFGGLTMDNVEFVTMPYEGVYVGKTSYVQAKPEELLALLNEKFNPYVDDLVLGDLDIMQYSDAKGFYTTRGNGKPRH